jgi:predicted nucleotidyltransferase
VDIDTLVKDKHAQIVRIAKVNGATRVRIFGSFARGTPGPDSDLDLLLHRPVHVVTEAAISPSIRATVLRDATPL